MKTITKAIQNGVSFAYISLLTSATTLYTSPGLVTIEEIDTDLRLILDQLKTGLTSLDTLIGAPEAIRQEWASNCQSHHKTLQNKFKLMNAYSRELNHISTELERTYHLKTTDLQDIAGIDYHQFVHEGLDFVGNSQTDQEKTYKIKEILRALPMRMTKQSFTDYVAHSLTKIAPNPLDPEGILFLSVFKQMFDGRLADEYGTTFSDIAVAIEDFRDLSESALTGDEIENIFDEIYLLKDTIEEMMATISILFQGISSLSTLLVLDQLTFDILCQEHVAFNDLFYAVRDLITGETHGEDYSIMAETLPDRLDDVFNEIGQDQARSTTACYEQIEKGSFPETEETFKLIRVFSLTQSYLTLSVEDAFSFHESVGPSTQLPPAIITMATDFLAEQLSQLKPEPRKLRMQYLMSMLPFTMDQQSFASYFDGALEGTSNEIQKAYVLAKISNFMDALGYFDALEASQAKASHDHHEHSHSCDHHSH